MSTDATPRNRKELQAHIIAKAKKDDAFRQALLDHPTETIAQEMGWTYVPDGPQFQVLEETADTFYLVLPIKRDQAIALTGEAGELSDEELDSVAGGARTITGLKSKPCEHD
ncbi:MAG: NHLP leader peptide family natural product precursor [Leptolyngbyaceae cyanobacterium RU_5_1]|nr:NHLP leader peptide family natural product precursor [Leptolyngbyaceae cyanobacterium RU_5_1]